MRDWADIAEAEPKTMNSSVILCSAVISESHNWLSSVRFRHVNSAVRSSFFSRPKMAAFAAASFLSLSSSMSRKTALSHHPASTSSRATAIPSIVTFRSINSRRPNLKSAPLDTLFIHSFPQNPNLATHSNPCQIRSIFTGIVEEMGVVKQIGIADHGGFDLQLQAKTVLEGVHLGDSIAVNGTCLTVTQFDLELNEFTVGLSPETLRKTSLSELEPGSLANLERALLPSTRMGGHFVQGHVDGTGEIVEKRVEGDSLWVKVRTASKLLKYIVPKGFIAVDGTSLTVVDVFDDEKCFNFMLVAYTQQHVVITSKKVGQLVNLEVDILGKYVERLLSRADS